MTTKPNGEVLHSFGRTTQQLTRHLMAFIRRMEAWGALAAGGAQNNAYIEEVVLAAKDVSVDLNKLMEIGRDNSGFDACWTGHTLPMYENGSCTTWMRAY